MEDYYWFVLDIKNNKVVNAFEEEYKEDAKEYIEMETEGDKEYRKNFKIISKRTKEKLGYEYPATNNDMLVIFPLDKNGDNFKL